MQHVIRTGDNALIHKFCRRIGTPRYFVLLQLIQPSARATGGLSVNAPHVATWKKCSGASAALEAAAAWPGACNSNPLVLHAPCAALWRAPLPLHCAVAAIIRPAHSQLVPLYLPSPIKSAALPPPPTLLSAIPHAQISSIPK